MRGFAISTAETRMVPVAGASTPVTVVRSTRPNFDLPPEISKAVELILREARLAWPDAPLFQSRFDAETVSESVDTFAAFTGEITCALLRFALATLRLMSESRVKLMELMSAWPVLKLRRSTVL